MELKYSPPPSPEPSHKSFYSGVKKVGGFGLGLVGKAYNAATGKKSLPAAPEDVKQRVKSTRHRDASDSGGIACKDVATVKDQRSVFSEVIKQIGKNVFAGRDLMYTAALCLASILPCISSASCFTRFACTPHSPSERVWASAFWSSFHASRHMPRPSSPRPRLLTQLSA
jgi:hypothetical protein